MAFFQKIFHVNMEMNTFARIHGYLRSRIVSECVLHVTGRATVQAVGGRCNLVCKQHLILID